MLRRLVLALTVVASTFMVVPNAGAADVPLVSYARVDRGSVSLHSDGRVVARGLDHHGDVSHMALSGAPLDITLTPNGDGYWIMGADGGIFSFGDAQFYGSTGAMTLNRPIVGMAATRSGDGYWLVASDGGIFSFGDAQFYGSTGAMTLNRPIVGMAATRSGDGYWLVASDGGIFSFGDAQFYGSTGAMTLNSPIMGMASTPTGDGYWLIAPDGGIFSFGDALFHGSGVDSISTAVAIEPSAHGYVVAFADGRATSFPREVFGIGGHCHPGGGVDAIITARGRQPSAPGWDLEAAPDGVWHLTKTYPGVSGSWSSPAVTIYVDGEPTVFGAGSVMLTC